jgi:hypothetical protein
MKDTRRIPSQVACLSKERKLISTILRLSEIFGDQAFDVVDHWESNFCAVGIAQKMNHSILVYIDNFEQDNDTYHVELERPPFPGTNLPFSSAGSFEKVSFEDLCTLISRHLELQSG